MEARSSRRTTTRSSGQSGNGAAPKSSSSKRSKDTPKKRSGSKKVLESFNPTTGELIGTVETLAPPKVQAVVDDVAEVQPFWAQLALEDRARYIRRAADVLLAEIDELAELLTREQGKPRVESYSMELLPTVDALKWIADQGPEILADEKIPFPQAFLKTKRAKFAYEPIGVVGVIAPWNYPWSIPFGEVAIALMAGNGVVLKPASLTPLIGERIRMIFEKAGFPEGLVRTIHGGGRVGDALVKSSAGKIFFTGSARRSSAPTPTSPTLSPAPSGAASPTPARPAPGSSGSTSTATSPTPSSREWSGKRSGSRSATRWSGPPRPARWSLPSRPIWSPSWSMTRSPTERSASPAVR